MSLVSGTGVTERNKAPQSLPACEVYSRGMKDGEWLGGRMDGDS